MGQEPAPLAGHLGGCPEWITRLFQGPVAAGW